MVRLQSGSQSPQCFSMSAQKVVVRGADVALGMPPNMCRDVIAHGASNVMGKGHKAWGSQTNHQEASRICGMGARVGLTGKP